MFGNMFDRRSKVAPSHYPRVPFHGLRCCQLVSSLIVGGIMSYFIWHLVNDNWATPWTFIWLASASLCSIAVLAFTIVLHCFIGLNPRLNLALNGFLAVLWALSFFLLTWFMASTLRHRCDVEHWREDAGVMVCRIYKALFTFTLFGFLSTIAALILDVVVFRQRTRRGVYRLHDVDTKRSIPMRNPFTDATRSDANGHDEPRESEAWDSSIRPHGAFETDRGFQHGYTVPEQQLDYDTGYRGHAG